MPAKKPAKGKVIDVTRPSRTPALNNSKHVIVNNTPVADPMVTQASGDMPAEGGLMTRTHKLVIQPIHTDIVPEETTAEPAAESEPTVPAEQPKAPTIGDLLEKTAALKDQANEPDPDEPKPEPEAKSEQPEVEPEPAPAKPVTPAEAPKTPAKTADSQVTPEAEQAAQAAEAAAAEQAAHVQALVEKGTYFLPINRMERRRNHRMMVLGLLVIIVLAVAWLDVALDAGLIPNSANLPHTHLFSTK